MSTSNVHQQSLADAGSKTRPSMLERGPYKFRMFTPSDTDELKMQTKEDLRGDYLKYYEAEIEAMNLILNSIPNDIYNSVDSFTTTKAMWERFDQFVAEPGEALVSVYNRFTQLMNDLERNHIIFPKVTINIKLLNCLQPEWLKYVTQVHLAKRLTDDFYDDLFDYLQQFEKLVNASRAKKLKKSLDPLALVAHTGSSSQYYVTHPSFVVDYDDDYQGDTVQNNSDDPLTSAMILLARAITRNFSNPTNNCLRTSSNTRNQAIVQGDRVNIQSKNSGTVANVQCYNCNEKGHYARNFLKPRVRDSKYFMEQILLAKQDEAGVILTDEQNDFLFADVSRMEEIKELSANICLMARIQPANIDSEAGPSYNSAFLIEYLNQPKVINNTIGDDQIDINIIFDAPNDDVNSGSVEEDTNVQQSYELEQLARNAYREAEKQQIIAKKVQQQNIV
ncbi:integrase, catalytic region, zinc finger, CCHC-type containing protein [Tanacetum coccineum]